MLAPMNKPIWPPMSPEQEEEHKKHNTNMAPVCVSNMFREILPSNPATS